MSYRFSKFEGTGNDFILVDDREETFPLHQANIPKLCHRQYGIGADGLILLQPSNAADYKMRIFNPNGQEAEMCGNGLRCLVDFLQRLGVTKSPVEIETAKKIYSCEWSSRGVRVGMGLPEMRERREGEFFIQVGVPHLVVFVDDLSLFDTEAQKRFSISGVNVNYAKVDPHGSISMRTFERGVESETFSCGTGATAVCFSAFHQFGLNGTVEVSFHSGERLQFDLLMSDKILREIYMTGKVKHIFEGTIKL